MGRIPDETIQTVRDRVDLVDLVGRYVSLRPSGRNHKGLCPFHDEKTPSFNVNADRQIFHCFGCGAGGNAFTFLMRQENLTFPEAVRELARDAGIEIRDDDPEAAGMAERLRAANDEAQAFYRERLASAEGREARAYLDRRGLDAETLERFGVGYAPDRWDGLLVHLRARGVSPEIAAQAGLVAERGRGAPGHYDRLRGRVTFPIRDARGRILGFGGRVLDPEGEPKYLNGPESPVYRKRRVLFGLPAALEPMRRRGRAVVVEGYFDVVALHRAGVGEAVATCGTALTEEHARELARRTREVVLLFDGDAAGRRALTGALEVLLPAGLRVRAVELPAGDDPDTVLAREGAEALRERVDAAPPALDLAIRGACAGGLETPWQRSDAVHAVAPLLAAIPDPVERGGFVRALALRAGVGEAEVEAVAAPRGALRGAGGAPGRGRRNAGEGGMGPAPRRRPRIAEERWLRNLAVAVLDQPELAAQVPVDEVAELVPEAPAALGMLRDLVEALRRGADPSLELAGESQRLYTELDAGEREPWDADTARRAVDETLRHMRRHHERQQRAARTRELVQRDDLDEATLLARKEEEIQRRRELHDVPSGAMRH